VKDDEAADRLMSFALERLTDELELHTVAERIKEFARPQAAELIADRLIELGNRQ